MQQANSSISTTLESIFSKFQQNPLEQFRIQFRQTRARQLRQLLADPDTVSLEIFNREVWPIGDLMIDGQKIGNLGEVNLGIKLNEIPDIMTALENGRAETHGNSIWGSGTRIYGSMLKESDEEKTQYIRQALVFLNDSNLTPLEKAHRIDELPGFGPNISTGLIMVFHPAEFAIYNAPSQSTMEQLGFSCESLEAFEESVSALKTQLGATDFIELDWFLYLAHKGKITIFSPSTQRDYRVWWVNQGKTFELEKAGSYLWAPKQGKNGVVFQHWTEMAKVRPGDVVLHYANGALRAVGQVLEGAQDAPRPNELPSDSWEDKGYLVRVQYHPLQEPIQLQNIPEEWRKGGLGSFTKDGDVKQGYLYVVTDEFAQKLQGRFHSVLPDFFQPANTNKQIWLFQANPKIYDIASDLKGLTAGADDDWLVTSYRNEMHAGDRVVIWEAGPKGGVLALGELTGEPFHREASSWRPGNHAELEWGVPFRYTHILKEPIPRSILLQDPVLRNMRHIRFANGTNFKVTEEEWNILQQLIENQQPNKGKRASAPMTFIELYDSIFAQGLDFSPEVVANYLLALQTKRFVILTGISGTGKTQLAMAVARSFSRTSLILESGDATDNLHHDQTLTRSREALHLQNYRLLAVRPDWRDNRGLLGYYNPLLEKYAVTPMLRLLLCAQQEFEAASREGREPIPFFIILDEMNLARVEHYFSDFLSSLESGEPLDLQDHDSEGVDDSGEAMLVPAQLAIHENVFFTGTVNIDETTYMFSPKVLDRAFTLELNDVNLATFGLSGLNGGIAVMALSLTRFPGWLRYDHKPNKTDWERFSQLLGGELQQVVVELNELLSDDRRNFGYRVAIEIARFVNLAVDQTEGGDMALWEALDLAIVQKVLPKFNGTQQELEEVLSEVFVFTIVGKRYEQTVKVRLRPDAWRIEHGQLLFNGGDTEGYTAPRLPRTATKVWGMWNRLRKQGFTSYLS